MLSPDLYKSSHTYDFFIRLLGYERSIDRFLRGLDLACPPSCRILDVGCGTGLLGLHFLDRFPQATLLATDLEPNFLRATAKNALRRELSQDRISLAVSDISDPRRVSALDGHAGEPAESELAESSFDLICMGAVVGYASDTESSIRDLLRLLVPGGCLVNLEMNESLMGRFVSQRYHYDNLPIERICAIMREEGCVVSTKAFSMNHFPAKMTRTAIIARRNG